MYENLFFLRQQRFNCYIDALYEPIGRNITFLNLLNSLSITNAILKYVFRKVVRMH